MESHLIGLPGGQRCCAAHREHKLISLVDIAREASALTHSRVYLMNQCRNKRKGTHFPNSLSTILGRGCSIALESQSLIKAGMLRDENAA